MGPHILTVGGIFLATVIGLNCVYGVLLAWSGEPAAPLSRRERWFIVLFGLQSAFALKLGAHFSGRGGPSIPVAIAGSLMMLLIALGFLALHWLEPRWRKFLTLLFIGYLLSTAAAIVLQPRVFHPGRE